MDDVVQAWLQSGQCANLDGIEVEPLTNPYLPGSPLVINRGQAAAYYLKDTQGRQWILKKFLPGRSPDVQYIAGIKTLVPPDPGFESGYERHVLASSSISNLGYFTAELASWIENTILMRVVNGRDWATLADGLRDGTESLSEDQRRLLCQRLGEQIRRLETSGLSHRDLSSTNVFVDLQSLEIHFIDWDSLYHATLAMPDNTTFGTHGYIAPFLKVNGIEVPQVSWAQYADRFSMAILNAEFLSMDVGSPLSGDGGAFDQDELYNRGGAQISEILDRIRPNFPSAVTLVEKALNAASFDDCPGPDEWIIAMGGKGAVKAAAAIPGNRQNFVPLNYSAFVALKKSEFVKLNR